MMTVKLKTLNWAEKKKQKPRATQKKDKKEENIFQAKHSFLFLPYFLLSRGFRTFLALYFLNKFTWRAVAVVKILPCDITFTTKVLLSPK